jgi:hypothetical protein
MPVLHCRDLEKRTEWRVEVTADSFTAGCSRRATVPLSDPSLSPQEIVVSRRDGGYVLEDLALQGRVLVNGKRVTKEPLADGDTIRLGKILIAFHGSARPEDAAPLRVDDGPLRGDRPRPWTETASPRESAGSPRARRRGARPGGLGALVLLAALGLALGGGLGSLLIPSRERPAAPPSAPPAAPSAAVEATPRERKEAASSGVESRLRGLLTELTEERPFSEKEPLSEKEPGAREEVEARSPIPEGAVRPSLPPSPLEPTPPDDPVLGTRSLVVAPNASAEEERGESARLVVLIRSGLLSADEVEPHGRGAAPGLFGLALRGVTVLEVEAPREFAGDAGFERLAPLLLPARLEAERAAGALAVEPLAPEEAAAVRELLAAAGRDGGTSLAWAVSIDLGRNDLIVLRLVATSSERAAVEGRDAFLAGLLEWARPSGHVVVVSAPGGGGPATLVAAGPRLKRGRVFSRRETLALLQEAIDFLGEGATGSEPGGGASPHEIFR